MLCKPETTTPHLSSLSHFCCAWWWNRRRGIDPVSCLLVRIRRRLQFNSRLMPSKVAVRLRVGRVLRRRLVLVVRVCVVGLLMVLGRRSSHPGRALHGANSATATTTGVEASASVSILQSSPLVLRSRNVRKKEEYQQSATNNDGECDPSPPVVPGRGAVFPAVGSPAESSVSSCQ